MKPLLIVTVVGLGSAGVGYLVGFKMAEKRLATDFDDRLKKETEGMREFYQAVKKPYPTAQDAAAALIQEPDVDEAPEESPAQTANQKVAYHKIVKTEYAKEDGEIEVAMAQSFGPPTTGLVAANLFDEKPHLISQEEFMENETEYEQGTLTYYKVDQVLTDNREAVIEELDETVGEQNMQMFGDLQSGSSDPNVLHIRNKKLQMEFEVCLSEGSYRQEILGIESEPPQLPSGRQRR